MGVPLVVVVDTFVAATHKAVLAKILVHSVAFGTAFALLMIAFALVALLLTRLLVAVLEKLIPLWASPLRASLVKHLTLACILLVVVVVVVPMKSPVATTLLEVATVALVLTEAVYFGY